MSIEFVSVGSTRRNVLVWISVGGKTEPMTLTHREAVILARSLLSSIETYMPEPEAANPALAPRTDIPGRMR